MKVVYNATAPEQWVANLARQLNTEVKNNTVHFPGHIGDGYIRQFKLEEGFHISLMELSLRNSATFIRKGVKEVDIFPIIFFIDQNEFDHSIKGETKKIGGNSPYGIYMPSPEIESSTFLPAGVKSVTITLSVTREWMLKNIKQTGKASNYIGHLVKSHEQFFLFEDITLSMNKILSSMFATDCDGFFSALQFRSFALDLLTHFFQKVNLRARESNYQNINSRDVELMFKVKQMLSTDLANPPSVEDICDKIGMSETKLQKCFKAVFGKSIYQYSLSMRMNEARALIETNKLTISEVGYQVGYTNLSHFTEAFRKEFGCNPKQYQKMILP